MIAKDLLDLADIKILGGQKPKVARELDSMLGLGPDRPGPGHRLGHAGQGPRAVVRRRRPPTRSRPCSTPSRSELYYTNEAIEAAGQKRVDFRT